MQEMPVTEVSNTPPPQKKKSTAGKWQQFQER